MIEHKTACRHIRCRCGTEFCYICGSKWWTCGCTERQLKDLKERVGRNAERRRAQEMLRGGLDGGDQRYWVQSNTGFLYTSILSSSSSLP